MVLKFFIIEELFTELFNKNVHCVDIIGNVGPVEVDVGEEFSDTDFLNVVIILLKKTAECADSVHCSSHF